jgi:cytochrome c oxidase subunit 2
VLLAGALAAAAVASVAVAGADLGPDRVVEVVARRFAFEPERIEVVAGERVRLVLRSADTTHGLEIEAFDVKVEIPKGGDPVSVDFVASTPGSYRFKCSEYCGSGHRGMKGRLVVQPKEDE